MKVLITGAGGQLGWELRRTSSPEVDVVAVDLPSVCPEMR